MNQNHPHLIRDRKQFIQGYNARLKQGEEAINPYAEGGEWNESWASGWLDCDAYLTIQAREEAFQKQERDRKGREKLAIRTEKQARNKANRVARANEQKRLMSSKK